MKIRFTYAFALTILIASCSQQQDDVQAPEQAPTSFTQKVVLELFNGAWCGFSPDGDVVAKELQDSFGADRLEFYEFHVGGSQNTEDHMVKSELNHYYSRFRAGIPAALINWKQGQAIENRSQWWTQVGHMFDQEATCGLAIDAQSIFDGKLKVKVKLAVGPEDLLASLPYFISCYLYEKEMSGTGVGWDQVNYYSKDRGANGVNDPNHPMFNEPDPIVGYKHPNVVRAYLHSQEFGDPVKAEELKAGSIHEFEYSIDISSFGDDLRVAAYLYSFESHPNQQYPYSHLANVQFVDVGQDQPFD